MNGDPEFKAGEERGLILGKLETMDNSIRQISTDFNEFKVGIGQRMENSEKEIVGIKQQVGLLMWVLGKIAAPILGIIGTGIAGYIGWQMMKK